ncbi:MAG: dual specificity protein phosphatase family protein [Actinobacteria bacterium]|nr:dual specificity protein phosphatase family protein [Actinomycetota bacterium]
MLGRERPIPGCYWVHSGRLLAGEYPGAADQADAREKLRRLRAAGVTFFLDLTEEGELDPYVELLEWSDTPLEHRRMAVRDFCAPSETEMVAILDTVDEALADGHVVYLHCWGGVGRTGTVVACHLVRHGASSDEALRQIEAWLSETPRADRDSPETPEQVALVRSWRAGQ